MIANWVMDKERVKKDVDSFFSKAKEKKEAVLDRAKQFVEDEWFLVILLGALASNAIINRRK